MTDSQKVLAAPTREQRLLMNLARASCAGKQSRQLEQFFEDLDNTGWLIELARVHVRLCGEVAMPHGVFALALQLREGRTYRLALTKDDDIRDRLVDLARVVLKLDGEHIVTRMQRTVEFQRFQRSLAFNYQFGSRRRGRKLEETFYASDAQGEEMEALRVRARLKIKDWAVRIGTSENTYRRKLDERQIPPEWLENARATVARVEDALLQNRASQQPVTNEELSFAFGRVWESYTAQTDRLHATAGSAIARPPESPEAKAAREAREDEAMLKFTPSAEEDLELDIGSMIEGEVEETDRVQPENLDERQ